MDKSSRRKSVELNDNDASDGPPGSMFSVFICMEDLIDKLKLLNYESDFVKEFNIKPFPKHYFAIPTNPGEQFYMFVILSAWLIRKSKKQFDTPQETDDPNATIAMILDFVRRLGGSIDFPPNRLKQGYGEPVVSILDRLADQALKANNFAWEKPVINQEDEMVEEENDNGEELDLDQVEEEMAAQYGSDEDEYNDPYFNYNIKAIAPNANKIRAQVLESTSDAETWKMEVERVIPRLKLAVKQDSRDWRSRLDMLTQLSTNVTKAMVSSQSHLEKISSEIEKNMERIQTRENYMNTQLNPLLNQYSKTQEQLKQVEEKYRSGSVGIEDRNQKLSALNEEIQLVKNEMDEKSSNMTDGTPLVNLKKVLVRMKAELATMDVRIGVASHLLLQSRLKQSTALQHLLLANSTIN
nr:EOG090X0ADS [Sida crystallina]